MEKRPMGSMIASGVITLVLALASAFVFFMMLGLALNGFMGQERAVNASFGTYAVLAGAVVIITAGFSVFTTSFLTRRFSWNSVLAMLLSTVGFTVIAGLLHFLCVIAAAVIAGQLRTNR